MDDNNRSTSSFPTSTGAGGLGADRPEGAEGSKWPTQNPGAGASASGTGKLVDFADLDNEALDRAVEGAHKTVDRMADTAAPYVQRLQHSAEGLRQTTDEWSESLRTTVRANPLTALATAVAVGVVFAKLTS